MDKKGFIKFSIKYRGEKDRTSTIVINPRKVSLAILEYVNHGKYGWVIDIFMQGNHENFYERYSVSPVRIPVESREHGEQILEKYFGHFLSEETFEL